MRRVIDATTWARWYREGRGMVSTGGARLAVFMDEATGASNLEPVEVVPDRRVGAAERREVR